MHLSMLACSLGPVAQRPSKTKTAIASSSPPIACKRRHDIVSYLASIRAATIFAMLHFFGRDIEERDAIKCARH